MTEILILYIDSDFIYPVVTDGHGVCEKYEHPDRRFRDFRLWLYFEQDMANGRLTPLKRARSGYYAGNPAFSGDVFSLLDAKDKPSVEKARRLLADSGVVSQLKEMYSRSGMRSEMNIPTVYVFAGNITQKARKEFIDFMEGNSFTTLSFSVPLESIAANTLFKGASFGDMLLSYTGSGNDMIGSNYIFDSKEFLLSSPPEVFKDFGYNPVREALVHYVVNKIESKYHFLVGDEAKRIEIEHQKQNVDQWLRDINLNNSTSTIAFKYKNFDSEYQVQIDTELFKNEMNRFVEVQLRQMNEFRNRSTSSIGQKESRVKQVLLLGDMFADEGFRSRVAASVGRDAEVKYIPADGFDALLCLYPVLYPELQENLKDFERVSRKTDDRTAATSRFIGVAGVLSAIAEESSALAAGFKALASTLKRDMDVALAEVEKMLEASNFNGAEEALAQAVIPSGDSPLSARFSALEQAVSRNREHLSNPNAKVITAAINESLDQIRLHRQEIADQCQRGASMSAEIVRLSDAWPEYNRLMEEFESAEVTRKRAIVDEITSRRLTRAPLPLTGLRAPFLAELKAEVVTTGKILGLFGGKKTLKVSVLLAPGYVTECKTVVLVQSEPLVTIKPSNIRRTIVAGTREKVDFEVPLPLDGKASKKVYVYLKPAPDQAISPNDEHIGVKHLDIEI